MQTGLYGWWDRWSKGQPYRHRLCYISLHICHIAGRSCIRGVQVKETLLWKRPWPPSINKCDGVSVRSVTQAKGPRGPIATCKTSILVAVSSDVDNFNSGDNKLSIPYLWHVNLRFFLIFLFDWPCVKLMHCCFILVLYYINRNCFTTVNHYSSKINNKTILWEPEIFFETGVKNLTSVNIFISLDFRNKFWK